MDFGPPKSSRRGRGFEKFNLLGVGFLTLALAICLLKIFYGTPLRTRVENKLYDIRLRLAPNQAQVTDIVVLAIDEKTLSMETESPSVQNPTMPNPSLLSFAALKEILLKLETSRAATVGVLLPPQLFSYHDEGLDPIISLVQRDRRFNLGIFDINFQDSGVDALPPKMRLISKSLFKANFTRDFRREIVREVIIKEKGELPYLSLYLGSLNSENKQNFENALYRHDHAHKPLSLRVRPNFVAPHRIPVISLAQWMGLKNDEERARLVDGKIVLVGYTAYRPATLKAFEATYVNSPWQEEGYDVVNGIPLVTSLGMTVNSLRQGDWLVPSNLWVNLFQTAVVSLLSLGAWYFSAGLASFLFILGWCALLIFHGFLFSWYSYYIPLADTALMSTFMTTIGALLRLRMEGRLQAFQEAKVAADRDVASVQDRFLNVFADELSRINQKIRDCLRQDSLQKIAEPRVQVILGKVIESCEELDDYLNGISHFSKLEASSGYHQMSFDSLKRNFQNIELDEIVPRILLQFEARIREKNLVIDVQIKKGCQGFGDGPITSQILYNLISNAIKYSANHGAIVIDAWMLKDCTKIRVKDNGPGIAVEFHQKIFEKFYRVKNDLVYKVKGHGLGLYLSSYFAQLIQGSIELESDLGKGSTFTLVMLPPKFQKNSKTMFRKGI